MDISFRLVFEAKVLDTIYFALNLQDYLTRYGYLRALDPRVGRLRTETELHDAVKKFQKFTGLDETGELSDVELLKYMETPRCGFPDFGPATTVKRRKRYVLQGSEWSKKVSL